MIIVTVSVMVLFALLAIASHYGTDRLCEDCYMKEFGAFQECEQRNDLCDV